MMPAGRGDLERAFGAFLALDVAEIKQIGLGLMHLRLWPRQYLRAPEMVGDLDQRIRRHDLDVRARPSRFGAARRRANQAFVARITANFGEEFSVHGLDSYRPTPVGDIVFRFANGERDRQKWVSVLRPIAL
jgi:hypothetical protein